MEFTVCLDLFEGPLDLMLHLLRQSKLDLFALNLDVLASQYCAYIRQALDVGLDVSSEYLVEFTTLMEYKSRKLLPRKEADLPEGESADPTADLTRRLQEYQRCKSEAAILQEYLNTRTRRMDREPASLIDTWSAMDKDSAPLDLHLEDLHKAMQRVLRRHALLQPYRTKVEVKELSVEERMDQLRALTLPFDHPFLFDELLKDISTLREAVVTFLAMLELVHEGELKVHMDEREDIWITKPSRSH